MNNTVCHCVILFNDYDDCCNDSIKNSCKCDNVLSFVNVVAVSYTIDDIVRTWM